MLKFEWWNWMGKRCWNEINLNGEIEWWNLNAVEIECWKFESECWKMNGGNWMVEIECWKLQVGNWKVEIEWWKLNGKYWMLTLKSGNECSTNECGLLKVILTLKIHSRKELKWNVAMDLRNRKRTTMKNMVWNTIVMYWSYKKLIFWWLLLLNKVQYCCLYLSHRNEFHDHIFSSVFQLFGSIFVFWMALLSVVVWRPLMDLEYLGIWVICGCWTQISKKKALKLSVQRETNIIPINFWGEYLQFRTLQMK